MGNRDQKPIVLGCIPSYGAENIGLEIKLAFNETLVASQESQIDCVVLSIGPFA